MKIKIAARVLMAFVVTGVALWGTPGAALASYNEWIISSPVPQNRCIDDPKSSTKSGTQVITYDCSSKFNQDWLFYPQADGNVQIQTSAAPLCLTVQGASTEAEAPVILYACNGKSNGEWKELKIGEDEGANDLYWLEAGNNNKMCLTIYGKKTANDTPLITYPCNNGWNEEWTWYAVP